MSILKFEDFYQCKNDEEFNIISSVHSDKRIIAVIGDTYYVYDSGQIIGYMIPDNKEVYKKVIKGYEKNGSYTFDYFEGHIFVFNDNTGEVVNISSIVAASEAANITNG